MRRELGDVGVRLAFPLSPLSPLPCSPPCPVSFSSETVHDVKCGYQFKGRDCALTSSVKRILHITSALRSTGAKTLNEPHEDWSESFSCIYSPFRAVAWGYE